MARAWSRAQTALRLQGSVSHTGSRAPDSPGPSLVFFPMFIKTV